MTEKLYPFEFKDTGVMVMVRKVSPMLVVELQKAFPAPTPPRQKVEVAGEMVEEPNPSHPDHLEALNVYSREMEGRIRQLLITRGVIIPEANTTWKDEVKELRKFWLDIYGKELEGDDKSVYISNIAVGTDLDLTDLLAAILQRSQPTEVAVSAAKDTFQG